MSPNLPGDRTFETIVAKLDLIRAAVLGHGGEAWVLALGGDRVVRILHPGTPSGVLVRRQELVDELARANATFRLPELVEVGEEGRRAYGIERRLPGRSVLKVLPTVDGDRRSRLIESYLEAVSTLGDLHLDPRGWYGELMGPDPLTAPTWREYLARRAAVSLSRFPGFAELDPEELADQLPEPAGPAFVHLDAFTGNVLTDGDAITAVIDVGTTSVVGDRRLDPLSAVVYLGSPRITPVATTRDRQVALAWLRDAGLADWLEPARRWLAAFWTFAVDDANVIAWCRKVLA
ncbi:MAG: phosphotransferase family protein [Acidimicrobiales bacterium]